MPELKPGDHVKFGLREGKVLRLERRHRIDGVVVQPLTLKPGDGTAPAWVPLTGVRMVRAREAETDA